MLFIVIIVLLVISFLFSLRALDRELGKLDKVKEVERELSKGKVIFQASHHSSDSESSVT